MPLRSPKNLNPGVFWYWNANPTAAGIRAQLQEMKKAGFACVYLHPMPDTFRKKDFFKGMKYHYLGKKFFELAAIMLDECKQSGLTMMLYDEGGWPSGTVLGRLVKVHPEDRIRFLLQNGTDEYRTLTAEVPDLLNARTTRHFLEMAYEPYRKAFGDEFGKTIRGIFTDEPAWWGFLPQEKVMLTDEMPAMLQKIHQVDFNQILPLLFRGNPDTMEVREARRMYTDVCTRLLARNYSGVLASWCRKHHLLFEGHFTYEDLFFRCAYLNNPMRPIAPMDVPGVDVIWRQVYPGAKGHFVRFASSAAIRNRRREALCECFQVYGNGLTSPEMSYVGNRLLASGINRLIYMPWLYSDHGQHKISCGTNFSLNNPVNAVLPELNAFWRWAGNFHVGAIEPEVWVLARTGEFGGDSPFEPLPRALDFDHRVEQMLTALDNNLVPWRFADDIDLSRRNPPKVLIIPGELCEPELQQEVARCRASGTQVINGFVNHDFRHFSFLPATPIEGIMLLPCRRPEGDAVILFNTNNSMKILEFKARENWSEILPPNPLLNEILPIYRTADTIRVPLPAWNLRIIMKTDIPLPQYPHLKWHPITLAWTITQVERLKFSLSKATRYEKNAARRPLPASGMYTDFDADFSGFIELETTFDFPSTQSAWIDFQAIRHGATLWVNGQSAGMRAFSPWAFKIHLTAGNNRLRLRVNSSGGNEWRRFFREELTPAGLINMYGKIINEYSVHDAECGVSPEVQLGLVNEENAGD